MVGKSFRGDRAEIALLTGLKLLLHPVLAFGMLLLIPLEPAWSDSLLVLAALPTGSLVFVLSQSLWRLYPTLDRASSSPRLRLGRHLVAAVQSARRALSQKSSGGTSWRSSVSESISAMTAVSGPGKARLIELIRETGLDQRRGAARSAMSYRRAWLLTDELNTMFGRPAGRAAARRRQRRRRPRHRRRHRHAGGPIAASKPRRSGAGAGAQDVQGRQGEEEGGVTSRSRLLTLVMLRAGGA